MCSSNLTQSTAMLQSGDVIQLCCMLEYGDFRAVPLDAVITWSVNGQPIPADKAIFSRYSSPTEVTALSTLLINDNYDATYECAATFSGPRNSFGLTATNAPDFFTKCTLLRKTNSWTISYSSLSS